MYFYPSSSSSSLLFHRLTLPLVLFLLFFVIVFARRTIAIPTYRSPEAPEPRNPHKVKKAFIFDTFLTLFRVLSYLSTFFLTLRLGGPGNLFETFWGLQRSGASGLLYMVVPIVTLDHDKQKQNITLLSLQNQRFGGSLCTCFILPYPFCLSFFLFAVYLFLFSSSCLSSSSPSTSPSSYSS